MWSARTHTHILSFSHFPHPPALSDKTGTLTQNIMSVVRLWAEDRTFNVRRHRAGPPTCDLSLLASAAAAAGVGTSAGPGGGALRPTGGNGAAGSGSGSIGSPGKMSVTASVMQAASAVTAAAGGSASGAALRPLQNLETLVSLDDVSSRVRASRCARERGQRENACVCEMHVCTGVAQPVWSCSCSALNPCPCSSPPLPSLSPLSSLFTAAAGPMLCLLPCPAPFPS